MADERSELEKILDGGIEDSTAKSDTSGVTVTANADTETEYDVQDALRRILEKLQHLSPNNQRRVLDTARTFYRLDPTHPLPGIGMPR